ncbi:MAG: saccharopine dehydrogenase NADP-binding domain-containing protein [Actinomycetota bacterium]|nr:saccharopine dehydrogenase NADP-binding domain-containing protein [Actinomycetota bacterium]
MRILVLGAAGRAGRAAIRSLLDMGGVEKLYLADRDAESLGRLVGDLGNLEVSPRFLEAESGRNLRERMLEADLVLGCLGPCHLYEGDIVEAAIAAGCDYISLCDDPQGVEDALSLQDDARSRGVSVLCGAGLSPGVSNLLALQAGSRLDRMDAVEVAWFLSMGKGLGPATMEHLLEAFGGKVPVFKGGKDGRARACSWEEFVEFPPPVGWQAVGFVGHPEALTLPLSAGGVLDVWVKGGVGTRGKTLALQSLAWLREGGGTELWCTAARSVATAIARRGEGGSLSSIQVTVKGVRDGGEAKVIRGLVGDYYLISGLVMAAAIYHRKTVGWPPGVYTPEAILDRRLVLTWLLREGVRFMVVEERPAL